MRMRLLKQYSASLIVGVVFLWFIAYPAALTFLNWTPPDEEQLSTLPVQLVLPQYGSPQFSVLLPDGSTKNFWFPQLLYGVQVGSIRSYFLNKAQYAALQGCKGTVSVAPVKWLIPERSFVWRVDCGAVSLPYSNIVSEYTQHRQDALTHVMWWGVILFGLAMLVVIFLKEAGVLTEKGMSKINKKIF